MAQLDTTINRLSIALDSLERAVNAQRAATPGRVQETDLVRVEKALDYLIEDVESLLPKDKKRTD